MSFKPDSELEAGVDCRPIQHKQYFYNKFACKSLNCEVYKS